MEYLIQTLVWCLCTIDHLLFNSGRHPFREKSLLLDQVRLRARGFTSGRSLILTPLKRSRPAWAVALLEF